MKINPPTKIYLNNSQIHGLGVIASDSIKMSGVIEICPIVEMNFIGA